MANEQAVIVDTCIWIPFFNQPSSAERQVIGDLLDRNRVAIIGLVVAEILQGFKRDEHAAWVAAQLDGLLWIEPTWAEWCHSATLGRRLTARGHLLPLTDLVVSSVALSRDLAIYTTDPHFDLLPELSRFTG